MAHRDCELEEFMALGSNEIERPTLVLVIVPNTDLIEDYRNEELYRAKDLVIIGVIYWGEAQPMPSLLH